MNPSHILNAIASKADLTPNGDGTYSTSDGAGGQYLVEIKVHDVTEAS